MLLSGSGKVLLAVDSPAVGKPNERVRGRPTNEIVTASPELAVRGPVRTATCAESRAAKTGFMGMSTLSRACHSGPAPLAVTNDPRPASPRKGRKPPSIGHMLPPPLLRRSTTQRQLVCGSIAVIASYTSTTYCLDAAESAPL